MKPLPQKYAMGSKRLVHVYTSRRPSAQGSRSICFVNNGVISIAYQFEPDGGPENISEEDRVEPVLAHLLQDVSKWHVSLFVVSYFYIRCYL